MTDRTSDGPVTVTPTDEADAGNAQKLQAILNDAYHRMVTNLLVFGHAPMPDIPDEPRD